MGVNFMSDTLYIQTKENVEVHHPHVYLQDIAKLSCTNSKILNHLRVLPVANLDPDKTGRYVISVMDLINDIQLKEPDLAITHIGEPNFIITYQKEGTVNIVIRWCKVIFVCLATFFGAGFSIMTFNNDVSVTDAFDQIYLLVTGTSSDGFTILEIDDKISLPQVIDLDLWVQFIDFGLSRCAAPSHQPWKYADHRQKSEYSGSDDTAGADAKKP